MFYFTTPPNTTPKGKSKFHEELKTKFPCFRSGREVWEAECLVRGAGTYVSVANKGAIDLHSHVDSAEHNIYSHDSGFRLEERRFAVKIDRGLERTE